MAVCLRDVRSSPPGPLRKPAPCRPANPTPISAKEKGREGSPGPQGVALARSPPGGRQPVQAIAGPVTFQNRTVLPRCSSSRRRSRKLDAQSSQALAS